MLVYGRTFLILEHRDAACNALQMSFSKVCQKVLFLKEFGCLGSFLYAGSTFASETQTSGHGMPFEVIVFGMFLLS